MTYKPASEETLHYLCSRPGAYFTPESSANYGTLHCGYECTSCKFNIDNTCQNDILDLIDEEDYEYRHLKNYGYTYICAPMPISEFQNLYPEYFI